MDKVADTDQYRHKILLSGGGTLGHINPNLAVAKAIKAMSPNTEIYYVLEAGNKFNQVLADEPVISQFYEVKAGKFRRYPNTSWWRKLLDLKTLGLNIRDFFRLITGGFQSYRLLGRLRPEIVFLKGSSVGVPVGLAAKLHHIPTITHDSDTVAGLANKLAGRWAIKHTVGMPAEFYPGRTVHYVGNPISTDFIEVDEMLKRQYRQALGLPESNQILLVIGGSLGAVRLNKLLTPVIRELITQNPLLTVIHQVGQAKNNDVVNDPRVIIKPFLSPMYQYSGAADLIISRGGASAVTELAAQGKATIVVPSPYLAGQHQLKNASHLQSIDATEVIAESELEKSPQAAAKIINKLLNDSERRTKLAKNMRQLVKPNAASELAALLLDPTLQA